MDFLIKYASGLGILAALLISIFTYLSTRNYMKRGPNISVIKGSHIFQKLIEHSQEVVTLVDERGKIEYMSPGVFAALGWLPVERIGGTTGDLIHPDDRDYMRTLMQSIVDQEGVAVPLEVRARHKAGTWEWMEGTAINLLKDSDIRSILITSRNVSVKKRLHESLQAAYENIIEGWALTLELRDIETKGHSVRVSELAIKFAKALKLDDKQMLDVKRGSLLHDIGKIGVPDNILLKEGKLTDTEWAIMRKHPEYAHTLLYPIEYLRSAIDIPYCHHEWWNGGGYPRGLDDGNIPLLARMFSIVDVFDALTSDRTYRTAWPIFQALNYIKEQSGTQFDPELVKVFFEAFGFNGNNLKEVQNG